MLDPRDGSLAGLQRFITDAVRSGTASPLDPHRAQGADRVLVAGKHGLSPADRLEIYREQFWVRHVSNLIDDFPTLGWVIGAPAFREVASGYLTAHPPRTWNLQRLGADLPAFIASEPRWASDRLAVDASRLDWAFMEAFDAPDASPLDLSPLAGASEDAVTTARLRFHPSMRRLAFDHPVHEVREATKRGDARERPAPRNVRVVVWRDATFAVRATSVEPIAFDLLAELSAGAPLGQACEAVANANGVSTPAGELGERVGAWFQDWTANGWVSEVAIAR